MPTTYEPIATTSTSSSTTTILFNSIPQTYTDLIIVASTSLVTSTPINNYFVTYNSDTGTNYSGTYVGGTGTSTSSGRNSNQTRLDISYQPSTQMGNIIFQVFSYSNTTTFKSSLSRSNNYTGGMVFLYAGLWRSTAAITSISITAGTTNIATNSTFTLYGIKAA
jgi:hypothetical protein